MKSGNAVSRLDHIGSRGRRLQGNAWRPARADHTYVAPDGSITAKRKRCEESARSKVRLPPDLDQQADKSKGDQPEQNRDHDPYRTMRFGSSNRQNRRRTTLRNVHRNLHRIYLCQYYIYIFRCEYL
jgi:hypothetical protein